MQRGLRTDKQRGACCALKWASCRTKKASPGICAERPTRLGGQLLVEQRQRGLLDAGIVPRLSERFNGGTTNRDSQAEESQGRQRRRSKGMCGINWNIMVEYGWIMWHNPSETPVREKS